MGMLSRLRRNDRRGQSLVEFAVTMPILLFLLLGIVDFARAWNIYEVLTDAGREGARLAVIDDGATTEQDVRDVVKAALGRTGIPLADSDIAIDNFDGDRGEPTTVTVTYGHDLKWVGWMMGLAGQDRVLNFTVASTMRQE